MKVSKENLQRHLRTANWISQKITFPDIIDVSVIIHLTGIECTKHISVSEER